MRGDVSFRCYIKFYDLSIPFQDCQLQLTFGLLERLINI